MSPCPSCATPAPEGERFCRTCGTALSSPGQAGGPRCSVHPGQPASGICPRCGGFACAECLLEEGGEVRCGACRARVHETALPWDTRKELGTLRAFWRTSLLLLRAPDVTLASARREAPFADSYLFAVLAHLLALAPSFALQVPLALWGSVLGRQAATAGEESFNLALMLSMVAGFLVMLGTWALLVPLTLAGVDHLALRLLGARPRPFPVTMRAWALSCSPMVVGVLPCCGVYVFPLWTFILKVMAYRHLHGTSGGRAVAAGMVVPLLGLLALVAYFSLLFGLVASTMNFT